jgi:hypothetical protein
MSRELADTGPVAMHSKAATQKSAATTDPARGALGPDLSIDT